MTEAQDHEHEHNTHRKINWLLRIGAFTAMHGVAWAAAAMILQPADPGTYYKVAIVSLIIAAVAHVWAARALAIHHSDIAQKAAVIHVAANRVLQENIILRQAATHAASGRLAKASQWAGVLHDLNQPPKDPQ